MDKEKTIFDSKCMNCKHLIETEHDGWCQRKCMLADMQIFGVEKCNKFHKSGEK